MIQRPFPADLLCVKLCGYETIMTVNISEIMSFHAFTSVSIAMEMCNFSSIYYFANEKFLYVEEHGKVEILPKRR